MSIYKSLMTFGQVYHNAVMSKGERITGISAVEQSELVFDYMIDHIESLKKELTDITDTITDLEKQVCELEDENDKLTE